MVGRNLPEGSGSEGAGGAFLRKRSSTVHTHFSKKDFRFAGWTGVKHIGIQANKEVRQLLSPGKINSFAGKEKKNHSFLHSSATVCGIYILQYRRH